MDQDHETLSHEVRTTGMTWPGVWAPRELRGWGNECGYKWPQRRYPRLGKKVTLGCRTSGTRTGPRSADEVYRRRTEHAGLPHHRLQVFARRPGARPSHVGDVE